jgi:hypothetical protein
MPEKETQETWYPSLRSTLWVLSLVHTYVEVRAVFLLSIACSIELSCSIEQHLRRSRRGSHLYMQAISPESCTNLCLAEKGRRA